MAEDPIFCRRCGAANPPRNRFCGRCGRPSGVGVPPETTTSEEEEDRGRPSLPALGDAPPAPPRKAVAEALAGLGAVGKPLAVGALALAAEAAAIWLARRAGRETPGPPPAGLEPEGYYEEILLVVTRGGTRPGRLLARRSGVFGRYTGGR